MLIVFPLLERYLRRKTCLSSGDHLSDAFFDELSRLFPALAARTTAREFWQIYRNGLLHEITLYRETRKGNPIPVGWVSHDRPMIAIDPDGSIWVNPVDFAQHVLEVIGSDFATFEESCATHNRLPTSKSFPIAAGKSASSAPGHYIRGTNTDP